MIVIYFKILGENQIALLFTFFEQFHRIIIVDGRGLSFIYVSYSRVVSLFPHKLGIARI